ncbi:GntR family transcriptional regulator [Saccharopolyspora sp. K220]|uniref:GntR family transcriptional regulator n=1 Tax=Saccharopolyspora soli TaxID=2926618 RepID=UPI001F57BEED|nr:GntR family transcriptional regulator [Saccharopolyspora soli]MCI2420204.1 GntR family transcriptional regulator [Saccharopolyspora soli]
MPEPTANRPPMSKADYVYHVLLREIRSAQIPGGTQLKAAPLAERLGVSITPVREALRRLENDRLVSYQSHYGATVIDLSDEALFEYYNVRAVVEGLGARLAADRITGEQLAQLRIRHDAMVRAAVEGDRDGLGEQSQELHLAIADIGGPAFLGQHARAVRNSYPVPTEASLWLDPEHTRRHLEAHAELLDALEAGDGAKAERIMIDHIRAAGTYRVGQRTADH